MNWKNCEAIKLPLWNPYTYTDRQAETVLDDSQTHIHTLTRAAAAAAACVSQQTPCDTDTQHEMHYICVLTAGWLAGWHTIILDRLEFMAFAPHVQWQDESEANVR